MDIIDLSDTRCFPLSATPGTTVYHPATEPKRACYFGQRNEVVEILGYTTLNDNPMMGRVRHDDGSIEWLPLARLVLSPNVVPFKPRGSTHA
jgi:hypothetical protein